MASRAASGVPTCRNHDGVEVIWATLREAGAVVLTSAAETPADFALVTEQFATDFRIHQNPARRRYAGDDTTQGVAEGADFIDLHAERSYLPAPPDLLFFCCLVPPADGGATTVCDGAAIVDALEPDDRRRLRGMTLVWRTRLEKPMWQRMWSTQDASDAIARLDAAIDRHGVRAQSRHWLDDGALEVEYRAPALSTGWISGRAAFANYLLLQQREPDGPRVALPDGRPVPPDVLGRVRHAAEERTVDIAWKRGDVVLIDNTRCMHGRRAFSGGERQILVRMGDAHPRLGPIA